MYHKLFGDSILNPLGAFVCWGFKLFRGSFNEQMKDEFKYRNILTGFFTLGGLATITALMIGK